MGCIELSIRQVRAFLAVGFWREAYLIRITDLESLSCHQDECGGAIFELVQKAGEFFHHWRSSPLRYMMGMQL